MGLAGMPGTWSRFMRHLFHRPEFRDFVVVYLDDICIFSSSEEEHLQHLEKVFQVLRDEKLYIKLSKCQFMRQSVHFLGHVLSAEGMGVDPNKTAAIAQLPPPTCRSELLRFLGLAGYYRRFIPQYATILLPLSSLVKKDAVWKWSPVQQAAFNHIKQLLISAPVLHIPDFSQPFQVTTDASALAIGGVLSQQVGGIEKPVAFYSKKLNDAEQKWPAHEREMYAIKLCLQKWRHYLLYTRFQLNTDSSACKWFFSQTTPSGKGVRWLDFFSQFSFDVQHRAGKRNVVADALSRAPPVRVASLAIYNRYSSRDERNLLVGLTPFCAIETADAPLCTTLSWAGEEELKQKILRGYEDDNECALLCQQLRNKREVNGHVLREGLIVVKSTGQIRLPVVEDVILRVLHDYHDAAVVAHPGIWRTYMAIRQWFIWPRMKAMVEDYVVTCEACVRNKSGFSRRTGMLQSLPIPDKCWQHVTMDFLTSLPESEGKNAIYVVVCRLSNRAVYIPTRKEVTAKETARLFFDHVVRYFSVPETIVSDRDPRFTSDFWQEMMAIMGVKLCMTVARRPQSDGRSERQIRTLEDSLRCLTSYYGDDWAGLLPTIEYAHACLASASARLSPFQIDTGRQPSAVIRLQDVPNAPTNDSFSLLRERERVIAMAKRNLKEAQARQAKYYNKSRRVCDIEVNDYVYIDATVLNATAIVQPDYDPTKDPTKNKLLPRWIGPFRVTHKLNSTVFKLELPPALSRRHPSFNADQLRVAIRNPVFFKNRALSKAAPVLYDEQGERIYVLERLLQRMRRRNQTFYLCKWLGLPDSENSWENEKDIRHVSHWRRLLQEYQARNKSGRM